MKKSFFQKRLDEIEQEIEQEIEYYRQTHSDTQYPGWLMHRKYQLKAIIQGLALLA